MTTRLLPDITLDARPLPKGLYALHLELLLAASREQADRWLLQDMTEDQHRVWCAVHRAGLMHQDARLRHVLTPYGCLYLEQRGPHAPTNRTEVR